ncbi:3-oxoacyl-(acyl-carrier-protein) synthase III [Streptomyces lincolnensis]|uniref:3-oxoacyl-(Acyl-carrier-protein) synthase III n=2 Tax=Streptomyces lincolnensis TaxID=1915 RepID=A0A1B1M3B3_STRLN|nr:3-oxoacyl-(acyl-carrier-protein) synthase III [Streptomyces lincolnensis]AXG52074.1 3-oxoacyl-(acyl-carrier-protein) synthase III [Streptomyces lincolnensis]
MMSLAESNATAVITGIGACLPEHVVDNDTVIARGALRTDDTWIRTRTGIARRRHAEQGTSTGDLAVGAGRAALDSAGDHRPDMLLLATSTPDHPCPATAPAVAHRLGLGTIPAFDLAAVCSGFLYALVTATALVRAGTCSTPLVIGADTYTTIVDPRDRETAPIFGDGAAAVLLRPGGHDAPGAVLATDLGADGSGSDLITVSGGGSRHPRGLPSPGPDSHYFRMQGRTVYAHAVRRMTQSSRTVLERTGWPPDTLGAFIGHQANQRILDAVAERLGIAAARRFGTIHHTGNTAAASIPLVMADSTVHAAVRPGERALLTAFGGGLTWASVALNWPDAVPRSQPPPADPDTTPLCAADLSRSHPWTTTTPTSTPAS